MNKRNLLAVGALCSAFISAAKADAVPDESIVLARLAVRCSIVYGMGSGATRDEQDKMRLLNIQRSLMLVAPKLGATRPMMEAWLSEFDKEFQFAIGNEKGKVADPSLYLGKLTCARNFWPKTEQSFMP